MLKADLCKEIRKIKEELLKPESAAQLIKQTKSTSSDNCGPSKKSEQSSIVDIDRLNSEVMGCKSLLDLFDYFGDSFTVRSVDQLILCSFFNLKFTLLYPTLVNMTDS